MSEYLPPTELHSLTGYARLSQQAVWLCQHGIPHRVDGKRVIVSREHVRAWLEGQDVSSLKLPDWRDYLLFPDLLAVDRRMLHPVASHGLYGLFNEASQLLYIGKTNSLNMRINQHAWAGKIPFDYFSAIEVPDVFLADLEVAHIHALEPLHNMLYERVRNPDHPEMVKAIKEAWADCLVEAA